MSAGVGRHSLAHFFWESISRPRIEALLAAMETNRLEAGDGLTGRVRAENWKTYLERSSFWVDPLFAFLARPAFLANW